MIYDQYQSITISKRIKNKNCSFQFLPESLLEISKQKTFIYKSKKLKSSYVIDIIHNLLLKYYFKKENLFSLSSTILKDKYGYLYNYYINYLKENKIIILEREYLAGSNSRIYSLNTNIINGKIFRFKNLDKVLIKKYLNKYFQLEIDKNNTIDKDIKIKLINDLHCVQVDYDKATYYLDSLKLNDNDIYNRNLYSVDSIKNKHIFYHFDGYGRLHTNFTILKSFIRKNCLLIDSEETVEFDLKNSQPLFLSKLMKDSKSKIINTFELELFSRLVQNGNYYQYLIDNLGLKSKEEAKEITYKILFGRSRVNHSIDKNFKKLFPTIYKFIRQYKKDNSDYRILAYTLQKAESNLIFNKIIRSISIINPGIKIITVHDSIIISKKYRDIVSNIFYQNISDHFQISF